MAGAPPISEALKSDRTCVLVIDVQNDFMEGGALAVGGADARYLDSVKDFVATCRSQRHLHVAQSRDFHPAGHSSFASSHGAQPFTEKELMRPDGETRYSQMMWPDHCVQETRGSELLVEPEGEEIVQVKGTKPAFDSYSAFIDDGGEHTGLGDKLKGKNVENVVLFGLATDFCVFFSATDAVKCGFKNVYVVEDLCRGIDPSFDWTKYANAGCTIVSLEECKKALAA